MSEWKNIGRELFPDHPEVFQDKNVTPTQVWTFLRHICFQAYEEGNTDKVHRIFVYARHFIYSEAVRLRRGVQSAFLQHLASHPKARDDLPNHFTKRDISNAFDALSWNLDEEEAERLKRQIMKSAKVEERPSLPDRLGVDFRQLMWIPLVVMTTSLLLFALCSSPRMSSLPRSFVVVLILFVSCLVAFPPVRDGWRWLFRHTNLKWTYGHWRERRFTANCSSVRGYALCHFRCSFTLALHIPEVLAPGLAG
jgi:hypothetical protein